MQTITISNDLDKKSGNITSEEILLIFDPGGDARNEQRICMINFFKEMVKNKDVKSDEVALLILILASCHFGELKKLIKSSSIPRYFSMWVFEFVLLCSYQRRYAFESKGIEGKD